MTRIESARLKSLGEAYAQKRLDLHLAKEMAFMAEKRFSDYLQEIADRDDPAAPVVDNTLFGQSEAVNKTTLDYLERIEDYEPAADVILDGKG